MRVAARLPAFAWLLGLFAVFACQPERAFLEVTINGLSPQVQTLEVRALLDDMNQDAIERFTNLGGPSTTVSLWLPPGARGRLTITATELSGGCTAFEGSVKSVVDDAPRLTASVELGRPSVPTCEVVIEPSGDGIGLVTVAPGQSSQLVSGPVSCGDRCTFRAPVGSTVTLQARVMSPSYLSKWSGPCMPKSPAGMHCEILIGNGNSRVGVEFNGRSCARGSFCNDTPLLSNLSDPLNPLDYTDLWGASADDLWVVARGGIILHKRSGWWFEEVPHSGPLVLADVVGTNSQDVWVVGRDTVALQGIGLHWDGTEWSSQQIPLNGYTIQQAVGAAKDAYFVSTSGGPLSHWDGQKWTLGTTQQPPAPTAGLWSSEGVTFTTGYNLYKYNGSNTWKVDAMYMGPYLRAIWGANLNDYWLLDTGLSSYRRLNGGPLQKIVMPKSADNDLFVRLHGTGPNDLWACSDFGNVYHYDGQMWTESLKSVGSSFSSIWVASPNELYVVGKSSALLHYQR